jgi:hypothetical protein
MTAPRQPNQTDLLKLAKALADFDVEYVVIHRDRTLRLQDRNTS